MHDFGANFLEKRPDRVPEFHADYDSSRNLPWLPVYVLFVLVCGHCVASESLKHYRQLENVAVLSYIIFLRRILNIIGCVM